MSCYGRVATIVLLCAAASAACGAQGIALRGGESQLEQASGAGMTLSYLPYSFDVFSGSFQGRIEMGAALRGEFRKSQFVAGDQILQITSPVYGDQSRGFYARGMSVTQQLNKQTKLTVFGGLTGNAIGSQFFQLVRPNQPIGSVQVDSDVTKHLSVFVRSLFSSRQSSIAGFDYHPSQRLRFGMQGGMGSNTPYAAATATYRTDSSTLEGSYVASQPQFRLVQVNSLLYQEPMKVNAHVQHTFDHLLSFDYRRTSYQFQAQNGLLSQFAGNTTFLTGRLWHLGWNAGFNQVAGEQEVEGTKTHRGTEQVNFGLNQSFGRVRLNAQQYRPISSTGQTASPTFTTLMVQEPLGRWMSMRQIANHSNNWSIAYGGEIHSNWINLSVDYQTIYNVFQSGPAQFTQGAVINGDLNLPRSSKLFVETYVTPDGRFLHSWGIRSSFVGPLGRGRAGGVQVGGNDEIPQIPRYLVHGKVLDAKTMMPIPDFPCEIHLETTYTNENGECSARLFTGREVKAHPGTTVPYKGYYYQLVEGPTKVRPVKGGAGDVFQWKVSRQNKSKSSEHGGIIIVSDVEKDEKDSGGRSALSLPQH